MDPKPPKQACDESWLTLNSPLLTLHPTPCALSPQGPCYPVLLPTVNNYQSCTYFGTVSNTSEAAFTKLAQEKLGADYSSSWPEDYPLSSVVGTLSSTVSDFLSAPLAIMERYVDDFAQGWAVCLVMGFFIPVALSFMWLFILRYFTGIFAYLIVLAVNVGAILCTIFLYMKARVMPKPQNLTFYSSLPKP